MEQTETIAVVGGGPAGLSAAWELMRAGRAVVVYERRAEAGGRMRTDEVDGVRFDSGVQLLSSSYTKLRALAEAVGVQDLLRRSPGRDAVWREGRAHPLVYGSVASMVTSTALSIGLKLKLAARYLPFLARDAAAIDVNRLVHTGGRFDHESIAQWGLREIGEDFIELMVYPMLGAYYGTLPEDSTAALYHGLAKVGLDVQVMGVAGGMSALPRAIASELEHRGVQFRYDAAVEGIRLTPGGAELRVGGESIMHRAVVVATPPAAALRILDDEPLRQWLGRVRSAPTATLALILDRPLEADFFGLSFLRRDYDVRAAVAACVQDRKLPNENRGSSVVMLPSPMIAAELVDAEPEHALDVLLPIAERVFPGIRNTIRRARLTAFPEGYSVFYPGYLQHVQTLEQLTLPRSLALAGDYLVAPTVEGGVRSGILAAERLLRHIVA